MDAKAQGPMVVTLSGMRTSESAQFSNAASPMVCSRDSVRLVPKLTLVSVSMSLNARQPMDSRLLGSSAVARRGCSAVSK